ncbi:hypothetical protein ACTFIZ_004744 [Dictyostelium cf. discoideum]
MSNGRAFPRLKEGHGISEKEKMLKRFGFTTLIYHRLFNLPKSPPLTNYQSLKQQVILSKTYSLIFSKFPPINHLHEQPCPLCNDMADHPYIHLFLECYTTRKFINIKEIKRLIFDLTGMDKEFYYRNNHLIPITKDNSKSEFIIHNFNLPDDISL